ncbi:hypothetical protein B5C34_13460 [Pacificimonas flava]|uniref:HTH tetR-type domain-containing protein n=2 Tax=Pacificimonas TaxID=1960290 RepID=A0A219B8B5_9SPHN|nr:MULTISPECIES: TetR/AcrR family transcriptional regulator [Pacificimonas]MBZ6379831.1 TetR family transcriptional regulator [Pacificimonas aurantium]OWV34366.1 hypothetical protein B5C34_13460 [Pacificimonas flava]
MTRAAQETTREELYRLVWSSPLSKVAQHFGMTANGIAKICDRLNVPRPPRGHWTSPAKRASQPPLGPSPEGGNEIVVLGGKRSAARRPRSRLSAEERNAQLLDAAAEVALQSGLQDVTLKRVARDVGISEAQAHNCFPGRLDLLLALARREISEVETQRRQLVARGNDRIASIVLSTVAYLHEVDRRGPLLQLLLRLRDVRDGLQEERAVAASEAREPILRALEERFAVERSVAAASTSALTALCVRAGSLVAAGRCDLTTAELLCLPMVIAGARSNETAAGRLT